MKFGYDRLCQGPKIDFLPFGTSKNPQNPENPRKNPENPRKPRKLVPHSYPLGGVYVLIINSHAGAGHGKVAFDVGIV